MTAPADLVRLFYEEIWNQWKLDRVDETLASDLSFRGSLGITMVGPEAFRRYVETVRAAFPDWHNRIDELIVAGNRVVARLTCSGTHGGGLLGIAPTGRRVSYDAVAIFFIEDERIRSVWVVGDTQEFWRALRVVPPAQRSKT
jgi:steroid delta-isomerase-like uncharacterized protein